MFVLAGACGHRVADVRDVVLPDCLRGRGVPVSRQQRVAHDRVLGPLRAHGDVCRLHLSGNWRMGDVRSFLSLLLELPVAAPHRTAHVLDDVQNVWRRTLATMHLGHSSAIPGYGQSADSSAGVRYWRLFFCKPPSVCRNQFHRFLHRQRHLVASGLRRSWFVFRMDVC